MKKTTLFLLCLLLCFSVLSVGIAAAETLRPVPALENTASVSFSGYTLAADDPAENSTYTVQVKVPASVTPRFYVNTGFDDKNGDLFGTQLKAKAGTKENGFRLYTVTVLNNVSRVSFRGTEGGVSVGGMTFASKDEEGNPVSDVITLRRMNGVINTLVDDEAPPAAEAVFSVQDSDFHYAVSGGSDIDENGYLYYRFLLLAADNDVVYTYSVTTSGNLAQTYASAYGNDKTVGSDSADVLFSPLPLPYKSLYTITAPNGATAQLYGQRSNYNVVEAELVEKTDNGNGTTSWVFSNSMGGYPTYRVSMPGKITKAGFIAPGETGITIKWTSKDQSPDLRGLYSKDDYFGSRGDDSMFMNVNGMGHLGLAEGDSFRLRLFRIWQIINNDSANWMIEPDFHYEFITGEDVVSVAPVEHNSGNATNNWLDLKAEKPGLAILEFSYDAITIVTCYTQFSDDHPLSNYTFHASDPARQEILIIQTDDNIAKDVTFGIKCPAGNWDYEFDTLYFTGETGQMTLAPTVKTGEISEVAVSFDKGLSWEPLTGNEGVYTTDIVSGSNIIRVTKDDGTTAYQAVRGDRIEFEVVEQEGNGDDIFDPGEKYRVNLIGVHSTIPKMSGIYNPGFGYGTFSVYDVNGTVLKNGNAGQYTYPGNAHFIFSIGYDKEPGYVYHGTNGYVDTNAFGSATGGHRNIADTGVPTNMNASETTYGRSSLPNFTITVGEKFSTISGDAGTDPEPDPDAEAAAEVEALIADLPAVDELTFEDKDVVSAARAAYDGLTDVQQALVPNEDKLTAAEARIAALTEAADSDAEAAAAVEALIADLPAVDALTLEDKDAVSAARSAYDKLTDVQQALVSNEAKLASAEARIAALTEAADSDAEAAAAVEALIADIPSVDELALDDKETVAAARAAYDGLTEAQKALVPNADELAAAEAKLKSMEEGDDVGGEDSPGVLDFGLSESQIKGYITISIEDKGIRSAEELDTIDEEFREPLGVIVEPTEVPFTAYDTVAGATLRLLGAKGITCSHPGDAYSSFYMSSIGNFKANGRTYRHFGEFDAGSRSGWMVTLNNWFINKGASEFLAEDGDIVKWQYTCDLGADIGHDAGNPSAEITGLRFAEEYGELTPAFDPEITAYDYQVGGSVTAIALEAEQANYWAALTYSSDGTNFKPMQPIPVEDGTVIRLYCEYAEMAGKPPIDTDELTITVHVGNDAADQAAADEVKALIDAIGEVTLTKESAIKAARSAYNDLSEDQRALVDNEAILAAAENKLLELKGEDEAVVKAAEDLIAAIGEVSSEKEPAVQKARAAYDALTENQKERVNNAEVLIAAEKKLAELKAKAAKEDAAAAKAVDDQIAAVGEVTLAKEDAVRAARAAYSALTAEQKKLVENENILKEAEAKLAELKDQAEEEARAAEEKAREDANAAKAVQDRIKALKDEPTLEDEHAVQAARAAYDKLTDDQKALVSNEDKLIAAEKAVADAKKTAEEQAAKDAADKAAADAVKARIAALPAEVTLDDEAAVAAARSAFDGLTDDQKALVDNEAALKAAEAKLAELKNRPAENTFVDVKEGAFYYDAVAWAVANGITNGTDAAHFSPAGECTRGQVVTFLWRAAGSPEPTSADNPFADVKEGKFYYNAVLWAVENGITNGTDATHFSPDATCTRGQVVTFQWRAAGSPAPQGSNNPFVDVKAGAFYENAVLWAVANGVTNGTDDTHFSPNDTCTRGQVVTFLFRAR
ncbi:MAG: S-layer homology domain-containing protein [Bacillota bacterium]|jgi:hypothetical protein